MVVSLIDIVEQTRHSLEERKRQHPVAEVERGARSSGCRRPFKGALAQHGVSIIAEYKRRSPSAGALSRGLGISDVVSAYERAGATCLSVLTEKANFDGDLGDLQAARQVSALPILRKDFIVDEYQLYETKAAGADCVLLIVGALKTPELARLFASAAALDLDCLVEVHDRSELATAVELGADLIGINNRDLNSHTVDLGLTFELVAEVPANTTVVSESGIYSQAQIRQLFESGVQAALVGESLMRASDPELACRRLCQATPLPHS
jgi:indole-3-glycerol phosphate synthase